MKLSRGVARFNRLVNNPLQGIYAWLLPPWAVLLHRGRRSGRSYRTPLLAFRRADALIIALLYGTESDWLRNLDAAGGGLVVRGGRTYAIGVPRVVETGSAGRDLARLPGPPRAYCRLADHLVILDLGQRLPGFGRGPR
ncbi:MAG: nitroreductase family deazaflavin-dependent oxidoreductase [Actinobacteria bacterium]|nr:nitroreductase family deazaflavin-dependent oxidoreductase [Actinomycetota bacterium]